MVHYLKKIPVHKVLRSVMPIFIIPIVGTLITAGVMMWGLGEPVGALTNSLTQWLQDAAGQHCYAGGDHGPDAGVRYGRSG